MTWTIVPRSASTEISTLTPNLGTWETGFEGMVSGNMLSGNYWLVVSSVSWQREVHSPVPCDQFDTWKLQNVTDPFTGGFKFSTYLGWWLPNDLSEFFEWASWFLSNISCLQITIFAGLRSHFSGSRSTLYLLKHVETSRNFPFFSPKPVVT